MYEALHFASSIIVAVGVIGVCAAGAIAVTKLIFRLRDIKDEILN